MHPKARNSGGRVQAHNREGSLVGSRVMVPPAGRAVVVRPGPTGAAHVAAARRDGRPHAAQGAAVVGPRRRKRGGQREGGPRRPRTSLRRKRRPHTTPAHARAGTGKHAQGQTGTQAPRHTGTQGHMKHRAEPHLSVKGTMQTRATPQAIRSRRAIWLKKLSRLRCKFELWWCAVAPPGA